MSNDLTNSEMKSFKESFRTLRPQAEQFFIVFCKKLIELYPETEKYLDSATRTQCKVFMYALFNIVDQLESFEHPSTQLCQKLQKLAETNLKLEIRPEQKVQIAEALLATLEYCFDRDWTKTLESCWLNAYVLVVRELERGSGSRVRKQLAKIDRVSEIHKCLNGEKIIQNQAKAKLQTTPLVGPMAEKLLAFHPDRLKSDLGLTESIILNALKDDPVGSSD